MIDDKKLQIVFQTLSDANRIRILNFIGDTERSVNEIVTEVTLSQPLVSHHLKILKKTAILETGRRGPFVFYRLKNVKLLRLIEKIQELFEDVNFE